MEKGMDFQRQTTQLPPYPSGNHLEPPQMDLETPGQPAVSPGECSSTASQGSIEIETRAPPRVDSCPDMDTRPSPEVVGMDAQLGTAAQESAFQMTATSPGECSSTASQGSIEIETRAPPRVDSCPDMDTRPSPEVVGMDAQLGTAAQESAFQMTATSPGECSSTASQGSIEIETRAPPRVDSCPDMDTRPSPEGVGMEAQLGTAAHESAFQMTATSPGECSSTTSQGSIKIETRAPPRVDSFPDMDTRPPSEVMGMEAQLGTAAHESAFHMQELLSHLPTFPSSGDPYREEASLDEAHHECHPCLLHIAMGKGLAHTVRRLSESITAPAGNHGLLLTDNDKDGMFTLFQCEEGTLSAADGGMPLARLEAIVGSEQYSGAVGLAEEESSSSSGLSREDSSCSLGDPEPQHTAQETLLLSSNHPALPKVPGPCDPEDLLDGVVFGAKYLGSTQLQCERHPMASTRMRQAQEAVDRVKAPDGESQPMTEVDVMVSTQRVKVLTADTQEALMDHPLQTISYTADIGNILVIMARRKSPRNRDQPSSQKTPHKMLCHVFQSVDAQLIAQAIGQAFGLAYRNFLHSEGVQPEQQEDTRVTEQLYNADLAHFTKKENLREVYIQKERGEMLGVAVVESGWGSLLPTVVIANLMHGGPAERSMELSIGDHVTSVNGTSLVGLPFSTCQGLIRDLKSQSEVILSIVRCPPVVTAIIQRPNTSYQLGFCVEDGVICSLVRGGIAERGGIRVGHRIIEINGQSVVATAHEKIIQTLLDATGEVHIKTMPSSTYRLLTGQETPVYL